MSIGTLLLYLAGLGMVIAFAIPIFCPGKSIARFLWRGWQEFLTLMREGDEEF